MGSSLSLPLGRGSLPPRVRATSLQGRATCQLVMDSFLSQERVIFDQGWATAGPCWCSAGLTSSSSSGCRPSCRRARECATVHKPRPRLLLRRPQVWSPRSQRHPSPLPRCQTRPLSSGSSPRARPHCRSHLPSPSSPHWLPSYQCLRQVVVGLHPSRLLGPSCHGD